ncbi:MAG TPA: tRNA dihydrouridine synthase DusB [Clostridiaceae bacterium]|nr:tRNA dihydrouridine synthase DusB [Clostridiaceae bacterium]
MHKEKLNINAIRDYLRKPLEVGNLIINNRLALAPLAGTSEVIFRSICCEYGVGLTTTELVSARGICYDPELKRNYQYLAIDPEQENVVAIQLFGHDPEDFKQAAQIILQHPILTQVSMFDINMGCPVKKVVKDGAGSALMKSPDLAQNIVKVVVEVADKYNKPVSVKIRSGWDQDSINAPEFAKLMEDAGAKMITVHARTRSQMYSGQADWNIIKQVVERVSIPVYGNGDLTDIDSILRMHLLTDCSGFAIGRAAQGNPWIFAAILNQDFNPTHQEWLRVIERHVSGMIEKTGDEATAIRKMRAQLSAYLKGKRHASKARNEIMQCTSKSQLTEVLKRIDKV